MNYDYRNTIEQFVTCKFGARILVRGTRDLNCFRPTVLVCPVHNDPIVISCSLPKRHWEFVKVVSEGQPMVPWSAKWAKFKEKRPGPFILPNKPRDPLYDHGSTL